MQITRQSALLVAPGEFDLVEEHLSIPEAGQVLVRTVLGAVSVGTELAMYTGSDTRMASAAYPLMTGYENVAEVIAVGSDADRDWLGKRILATYGHRTHAIVDWERLIPIPDDVPDEIAILAILAADADVAVERVSPRESDRCLITGAGAMGVLTLLNLHRAGVSNVTVTDTDANRLTLPHELGADTMLPDELDQQLVSGPAPFSVAFECSAAPAAFHIAQHALKQRGRIAIVSDGNGGDLVLSEAFHDRELAVFGCDSHRDLPGYAGHFFRDASTHRFDPYRAIFDRDIPFHDLPTAFARMATGARPRKPPVRYG